MNIFITIDASNRVTGVFSQDASPVVPTGAIPLSVNEASLILNADHLGDFIYVSGALQQDSVVINARALQAAKNAASASMSAACQAACVAGFASSALGTPFTYPSNLVDQQNLSANVLSSTLPAAQVAGWTTMQLCADASTPPVWAYRAHTVAQIQRVGDDGKAAIMANLIKNAGLQAQIVAAADIVTVQGVKW
jgi:hypothetical protein